MAYRDSHSIEYRRAESGRMREKYPDKIPVICEKSSESDIADLDRRKFLIPQDLIMSQFNYVVRRRLVLPPENALFIFLTDDHKLPSGNATMMSLYDSHCNEDGFLYMTYASENTFG